MSLLSSRPVQGDGIITVGGRPMAVGLTWRPPLDPAVSLRREARRAAKSEAFKADILVLRDGVSPQYGLGYKALGHRPGVISAAGALAGRLNGSWMGVFQVPEGWWFVCAREDLVLPEGDRLFTDAGAARTAFEQNYQMGGWGVLFAPAAWGYPEASATSVEAMIPADVREPRLSPLSPLPRVTPAGVALVALLLLAGGGVYGWMQYQEYQLQLEQEILAEQERLRQDRLRREQAEVRNKVYPFPTEQQPVPLQVWSGCREAWEQHRLNIPGWKLERMECDGTQATAVIRRERGNVAMLQDVLKALGSRANIGISDRGDGATMAVRTPRAEPRGTENSTLRHADLARAIVQYTQEYGGTFTIGSPTNIELPQPQGATSRFQNQEPVIMYQLTNFDVRTRIVPENLAKMLTSIGAVGIDKITFSPLSGEWQITGQFFQR